MTFKFDGFNWLVRLDKGELLIENLNKLVADQKIGGAWLNGVGGALWAELGFYDLSLKDYHWRKIGTAMEITGLQGNVAWDNDRPLLHIHGTFTDSEMRTYGGHVKELAVAATCEILLHRWYQEGLTRSQDNEVGLKLLDI